MEIPEEQIARAQFFLRKLSNVTPEILEIQIAQYLITVREFEEAVVRHDCPAPMSFECAKIDVADALLDFLGVPHARHPSELLPQPKPRIGYHKKPISEVLRWQVFERDGFCCVKCGSKKRLTADHRVPEIKGGQTSIENLQTLCRPCNSRKGARP